MDIDIDFADDTAAKNIFRDQITLASIVEKEELIKHPVGVYFQAIPKDRITGLAAIPCIHSGEVPRRDRAQELGYMKIDFLHVEFLRNFKNKQEIRELLKIPPDWSMLEHEEIVEQLFHLHNHFDIVHRVKPTSVDQLADILMLIRPKKVHLMDKYVKDPASVREELHTKREKSDLRRSHALPYAMLIVLNMHVIQARQSHEITTRTG
jgi:hypothetical protein